jgi:hypothetical protein
VVEEEKNTRVEQPDLPDVPPDETRRFLDETAAHVSRLAGRFPEFQAKLEGIAAAVRAVDGSDFRNAELTLTALEERLVALLQVAADEETLVGIQQDVDAALGPFRSTMTAPQLAALERQLRRRTLLEAHDAPRLSLFYLV